MNSLADKYIMTIINLYETHCKIVKTWDKPLYCDLATLLNLFPNDMMNGFCSDEHFYVVKEN